MTEQRHTRLGNARRCAAAALVAVLVVGTASGCSDASPAPEPLEEATSAASTTPSPTPEPSGAPTLPPEARGTSKQAAIAFVEHWVNSLNYSMTSLDTSALAQLGTRQCEVCAIVVARVDEVADGDGDMRGAGWRIEEAKYLAEQPPTMPVVQTVIDIAPQTVIERSGGKPQRFGGGRVLYTFHLTRVDGAWRVEMLERAT